MTDLSALSVEQLADKARDVCFRCGAAPSPETPGDRVGTEPAGTEKGEA